MMSNTMENKQENNCGVENEFKKLVKHDVNKIANCFSHHWKCKPKQTIFSTIWEFQSKHQNHMNNFPSFERWMTDAGNIVGMQMVGDVSAQNIQRTPTVGNVSEPLTNTNGQPEPPTNTNGLPKPPTNTNGSPKKSKC